MPSGCTHKFAPRLEAITPDRARRGTNRKSLEVVQSEWLRVPQKGLVKKIRRGMQPNHELHPHRTSVSRNAGYPHTDDNHR